VQELPFTDLPSSGKGDPVTDTGNRFSCTAGRLEFKMALRGENGNPVHARQTCGIEINVTDSGGQPVTRLQPLMNAFAHLVGFYDDYHTVVHLHPSGGDVLNPDLRGGPRLSFVFYPPKPGFIRLYCQVCINGEFVFAPFNVNITP
jgi:hypothetical protein